MGIQRKLAMTFVLILLLPSTPFAFEQPIRTGYDLYHNIQLMDKSKTSEDLTTVLITTGYLMGVLDGMVVIQQVLYDSVFPRNVLTEQERQKMAKEINFRRLNIPESGLPVGQFMLIYTKYAEKHPEGLNHSAKICIFEALVEAYGWK
jgi:hypothetical protein